MELRADDLLDSFGKYISVKIDDSYFKVTQPTTNYESGDFVVLHLEPEVAEQFRQEGRRQLQAELRQLLNVARR